MVDHPSHQNKKQAGYFIVGTDTGVGKTVVTCALLNLLAAQGKQVIGMKPVAAGCEQALQNMTCEDVVLLKTHSNVKAPRNLVNPYAFVPPIAPHIAAEQSDICIDLEKIKDNFQILQKMADIVLVEGVGGFMVPLNATQTTADLTVKLSLPVILVVGLKLGCINHALLTVQAITHAGLNLVGWVANQIDPTMLEIQSNLDAVTNRIHAPLLGIVPYSKQPQPNELSQYLKLPF